MPLRIFTLFRQIDLKNHEPELPVGFIPQVMDIPGRTNECISGFCRIIHTVDGNQGFSFENVKHLGLLVVGMYSLPGIRGDGNHLE